MLHVVLVFVWYSFYDFVIFSGVSSNTFGILYVFPEFSVNILESLVVLP